MNKFSGFLERKDIRFTAKRYFGETLSAMATGLFASLVIGLILKTLGEETLKLFGSNLFSTFFVDTGTLAMGLTGAAIGIAVSYGLKAPILVMICGVVTGSMGYQFGGAAGSFVAAAIGCEFGKAISRETKVDIIVTPAITLIMGMIGAKTIGPVVNFLMTGLGSVIMSATVLKPVAMGIIIAVIVGLVLTSPLSSAALCIMLDLSGLAAGAAAAGCCAQMIGFATISFKDNGVGGFIAQGIGTSMLQISNIVKNFWIVVPPTLAAAVVGPLSTKVFHMTCVPSGAGMGTSGLVGQIGTFASMGFTTSAALSVLLVHIVLPMILSLIFYLPLVKLGKIKSGDLKLDF